MDNTPEYIEMCRKAVEIQDIWKNRCPVPRYIFDRNYFCNLTAHKSTFIWLPRQDQLQGMVDLEQYNHLVIRYDNRSDNRWSIYFRKSHTSDYVELYAIGKEQLWLAFVMHEKYGKKWDGKDWKHN